MKKIEVTGQAVIYTKDGVKVVDAEVRRFFNIYCDSCTFKFDYPEDYLLIGGARTVPTEDIYAKPAYHPERIQQAINYGESKFFRLMLDLMRLAQWDPINKSNRPLDRTAFTENRQQSEIDYDKKGFELDSQLYEKWRFTPAQIKFVEERYQ